MTEKKKRPGWRTAGEILDELEKKPEYMLRQAEDIVREEASRRRYADAAQGLLSDLKAVGIDVTAMDELRAKDVDGRPALPILVKWLRKIEYQPLKEDVIATLGARWAKPAGARPLIDEFDRIDPDEDPSPFTVRWGIGDALEKVADESVIDDLIRIASDRRHGVERGMVVLALGKMKKQRDRVIPLLLELAREADVGIYAVMALGKLKATEGRSAMESFLTHPDSWFRDKAKRALAKLDRA